MTTGTISFQRLKDWIIKNYEERPQSEEKDLVWLRKTITPKDKINWSFVDTVDYNIDSIPRKREIILDFIPKKIENIRSLLKNG